MSMNCCNYCSMRRIRMDAKMANQQVTLFPWRDGIEVYVHPRDVRVGSRSVGQERGYWKAWFMKLSNECNC
jgi:hypothetical protein